MAVCTNIHQQVFCLSMGICDANNPKYIGTASELQGKLKSSLEILLTNPEFTNGDDWELAWGPFVWQAPYSKVVDQAVAICYNSSQNIYVVPIAGTNPYSPFDIYFEDLAVASRDMHPFPGGKAGNVSWGNAVALNVLLDGQFNGNTLSSFLSGKTDSADSVVVCGHSLGGGLTPLLALALFPKGMSESGWKAVYTYPTAGPSTGDEAFATAFNKAFPIVKGSGGYQMWNANQYNKRDMVPHAWSGDTLAPGLRQIRAGWKSGTDRMYYTTVPMSIEVEALRSIAEALPGPKGNPYVAANSNPLFPNPSFPGSRYVGQIKNNDDLCIEILEQHITAYADFFGVSILFPNMREKIQPPLLSLVPGVEGAGTRQQSEDEEGGPAD